jgi:hypothetical protein
MEGITLRLSLSKNGIIVFHHELDVSLTLTMFSLLEIPIHDMYGLLRTNLNDLRFGLRKDSSSSGFRMIK